MSIWDWKHNFQVNMGKKMFYFSDRSQMVKTTIDKSTDLTRQASIT